MLVLCLTGCAAADEQQVTYRIEVLGGRTAVELADLEVTPAPTRGGDVRFSRSRFLRRYEFDWSLEELARGTPVTIRSRRAGTLVDTVVLAPFLCASFPPAADASVVVEQHEVAINADGFMFVGYDIESALNYSCSAWDGGDGEVITAFSPNTPTCADLPGFDTDVHVQSIGLAPVEPYFCSSYQGYQDGIPVTLGVVFNGALSDGRRLLMGFSVCASPTDVPLVRTVESVTGTGCFGEGFHAFIANTSSIVDLSTLPRFAGTGTLALSAIDDSRDGWLEGTINVTLTSPSGEQIDVIGPFRLSTLRM